MSWGWTSSFSAKEKNKGFFVTKTGHLVVRTPPPRTDLRIGLVVVLGVLSWAVLAAATLLLMPVGHAVWDMLTGVAP